MILLRKIKLIIQSITFLSIKKKFIKNIYNIDIYTFSPDCSVLPS